MEDCNFFGSTNQTWGSKFSFCNASHLVGYSITCSHLWMLDILGVSELMGQKGRGWDRTPCQKQSLDEESSVPLDIFSGRIKICIVYRTFVAPRR